MAVVERNEAVSLKMRLNTGTGPDGKIKYTTINIAGLSVDRPDDAKYIALTNAIKPILKYQTAAILKTVQSTLTEED